MSALTTFQPSASNGWTKVPTNGTDTGGMRPRALFEYFEGSDKKRAIASKILEKVDIGVVDMPQFLIIKVYTITILLRKIKPRRRKERDERSESAKQ